MLLVAMKCKTHGWPNHAGSYYSSSPFDHAANGELTCSRAATRHRQGQGVGADLLAGHREAGQGKSSGRAAPRKPDRDGITGSRSRGKWDAVCAAWHKGSEPWRESRVRAGEPQGRGEGREDSLFLFTQQ